MKVVPASGLFAQRQQLLRQRGRTEIHRLLDRRGPVDGADTTENGEQSLALTQRKELDVPAQRTGARGEESTCPPRLAVHHLARWRESMGKDVGPRVGRRRRTSAPAGQAAHFGEWQTRECFPGTI